MSFALVLAFDTDDPEFVRGVEIGMLWQRMKLEPGEFKETIHATNVEMLMRVSEVTIRGMHVADTANPTWVEVTVLRAPVVD